MTGRHTYAVFLLSTLLIPADIVQRMLGHASNRQTLHYAKMLDSAVFQAARGKHIYRAPEPTKEDMKDLEDFAMMFDI